ncbi:MAG: epoxyqueuosine reductase [Gemmatimonadales bacterium]
MTPSVDDVRAEALRIGFAACGIARLDPSERADALDRWLGAGYGGTMRYLHRQAGKRKWPASITPGARTAIVVLDATRCLSYLTIEYRGSLPVELLPHWDGWAFGCDVCNEVCPWNVEFAQPTAVPEFGRRPDPDCQDPLVFDRMDEAGFARRFADTPLSRPGLDRMRRNVAVARQSP